eukprot:15337767-Ditylum_brightwellii.AAC.1
MTFNKFKISFSVPKDDKIKPWDKFAMLFSVLQQQYNDAMLEQWDADDINQVQSIISGSDLPHKREKLAVYCPHIQRNTHLETQWCIKSTAKYYELMMNQSIMAHLQRHRIFMNPMEIKQIKAIVAGKDAAAEIKTCAFINGFDLHVHTCHHMQQSKLYWMNNQRAGVKDQYPHTKHWIFVPFKADGTITEKHIAMMICKQNAYLRDKTAISVTGLHNISALVTIPGTTTQISFHCWLLTVKTADELTLLFSAAEKDPNNVYYFVTKKILREEAETRTDDLPETLVTRFLVDDMDSVTTDTHPMRSYRVLPTENTNDAISAYNSILANDMVADSYDVGAEPKVIEIVEEDILEKCWKAPPCSIHSNTETDTTQTSTVSGIAESNFPAKSTAMAQKEKE